MSCDKLLQRQQALHVVAPHRRVLSNSSAFYTRRFSAVCSALLPFENRLQYAKSAATDLSLTVPIAGSRQLLSLNDSVTSGSEADFSQPNSFPVASSHKLRVAVDVDEVLGRFLHTLNKFCREKYSLDFDVSDYFVYDFATIWKCSQDESNSIVHDFFQSHHFSTGIPPIPGALDSLGRLGEQYDLVVVTSRQHVIQQPTLQWLETHYPGVFAEVHFGNHYALEGASRKKSQICRDIGADILIDDNPWYALDCAEAGIHVLLYDWDNAYPWSKTTCGPRHPLITRVHNWDEVEAALAAVASTLENS